MWWILVLLGLALVGAALASPLQLAFCLEFDPGVSVGFSIGWLYGLLRQEVRPGRGQQRKAPSPGPRRSAAKRSGGFGLRALIGTPGFLKRLFLVLQDLVRVPRWDQLTVRGSVGLDDPADTGLLFATLYAALSLPTFKQLAEIQLHPNFLKEQAQLKACGSCSIQPFRVLWVLLRFVLSPVTVKATVNALRA